MGKAFLAATICLAVSAVAIAQQRPPVAQQLQPGLSAQFQPLNVKTGNWQVTSVSSANVTIPPELQARLSQLPPEARAALQSRFGGQPQTNTYNSCVKPSDLTQAPFQDPNQKCAWKALSSTGSDLVAQGTCQAGANGTFVANIRIHAVDSENTTASVSVSGTANGSSMNTNATLTGKWVGATCQN
jgi:hypothetical protein